MSDIFRKILGNTAAQIAGKLATSLLSIVLIKIISQYLGVQGYGYYTTVFEFLAIFGIIADAGIYTIAVREGSGKTREEIDKLLANILGIRLLITGVSVVAAAVLVLAVPSYAGTPVPLGVWVAAPSVYVALMAGTLTSILQIHYHMQQAATAQVLGKVAGVLWVAAVAFVFFPGEAGGTHALLWCLAGATVANLVQLFFVARTVARHQRIRVEVDRVYWWQFVRQALPYGVAIFLSTVYFKIAILSLSLIGTAEQVGVYAVALRLVEALSFIPLFFLNSLLPAITTHIRNKEDDMARSLVDTAVTYLYSIGFFFAVASSLFAVPLTVFLASPDFLSGGAQAVGTDAALRISAWALFFSFANGVFVYTTVALGRQQQLLYINSFGVVLNTVMCLLLIPQYGIIGAAISTVVTEFGVLVANYWLARRLLHYRMPWGTLGRIFGTGLLVWGPTAALWWWLAPGQGVLPMLAAGALAAAAYGALLVFVTARDAFATIRHLMLRRAG